MRSPARAAAERRLRADPARCRGRRQAVAADRPDEPRCGDAARRRRLKRPPTQPRRRRGRGRRRVGPARLPRQGQPRGAHAAQLDHRLRRADAAGAVRPDRQSRAIRAMSRTSIRAGSMRCLCSTTCSTSPRSRPASSSSNFTAVDVPELVEDCAGSLQPLAKRARIVLRTSLAPDLPTVVADPRRLKQILLNLLTNAIKFTKEGGQVIVSGTHGRRRAPLARARQRRRHDQGRDRLRHAALPPARHRRRASRRARASACRSPRLWSTPTARGSC